MFATLGDLEDAGLVLLGRGKVISKIEIRDLPGDFPVYSSSAAGNGEMGRYGKFMFDDERITWSIDGGGRLFYRPAHKYSVTNVCGWLKVISPDIDAKYLCLLLLSKWQRIKFDYTHKAHPSVIREEYKDLSFPPLPAQQRIADELDQLCALKKNAEDRLAILDQIVKSRFVEMFGNFKSNPKKWPITPFDDVAEIEGGLVKDFQKYANYPHIGIDSIAKDTGELVGYRTVAQDSVKSGKYLFTPRHIIYSKIRPNLNKVALPDFEGLCSADSYAILPKANADRVFLAYVLRSQYFLDYIVPLSGRSGMPKANQEQVRGFRMPFPPLALQREFAAFVAEVDKSKLTLRETVATLDQLYRAKLQECFG